MADLLVVDIVCDVVVEMTCDVSGDRDIPEFALLNDTGSPLLNDDGDFILTQ